MVVTYREVWAHTIEPLIFAAKNDLSLGMTSQWGKRLQEMSLVFRNWLF